MYKSFINIFKIDFYNEGLYKLDILNKWQKAFIFLLVLGYIIFASLLIYTTIYLPPNIMVHGEKIGGKKKEELESIILEIEKKCMENSKIIITYENESYLFDLGELGITTNKDQIIKDINKIYKSNPIDTMANFAKIHFKTVAYNISYEIKRHIFYQNIKSLRNIDFPQPKNASLKYDSGKVIVLEEEYGLTIDEEELINLINNIKVTTNDIIIEMPLKKIVPKITKEQLHDKDSFELISEFTTEFNPNQRARTSNLKIATEAINGTILAPGESFSFNKTVGPRTTERGFKSSPIYVAGQILDGIGGGICQVSSTLYNAVLLANLEVLERVNHGLTVPYVSLSRDATVSWGAVDFRFKNSSDNYIYIHAEINNNKLTFEIHGTKTNQTVILKSERISIIPAGVNYINDNTLPKGKEIVVNRGQQGYTSRLIKEVYEDGVLIDKKVVSTDRYLPTKTTIRRGTASN